MNLKQYSTKDGVKVAAMRASISFWVTTTMKRRTFLASVAAATVGGTLDAALSGLSASPQGSVRIRVSFFGSAFQPVMKALIDKFREQAPQVEIGIQTPAQSWDAQLQRTVLDMRTGGAAELAVQGYDRLRIVADSKAAVPLDALISQESGWAGQGYSPGLMSLCKFGGQQWGLPLQISNPVIFYNAELFRSAGVDPETFTANWDSAAEAAQKITALGGGKMGAFFDYTADGNWMYQALLFSLGGQMMSDDEKAISFDDATGLRALQILRAFGKAGQQDMTAEQGSQSFAAGVTGMIFTSNRRLGAYKKAIQGRFELGSASLPKQEGGHVPVGGGFVSMTTADPRTQKAAWEFLKFASGPVGQAIIVRMTGAVPGNANAASKLGDYYATNPQAKAGLEQLPIVTGWYSFPGPNAIKISEVLLNHLRSVVTLKITPENALKIMRADVDALLPKV
ncbi:ABC transporter substrate-binding protein [Bradyrhizobium sp. CCBAU 11386]|uniref:ABC transporter substrate-binding protein n=1 Tax=Bradyrhizobium sp. CCBAU 11386 TaxID=1630837 RepID=UPI0023029809|nr:ABC transporter substrate-binding protein [Bradyrhizobium sp. CCBAU 11386]